LQVTGTPSTDRRLDFELLNSAARVAGSVYVMAGLDAKAEVTKSFPIDHAGRYVVRLVAEGKDSGTFCVLIGGTALPSAKADGCPATTAGAVVAPPRPAPEPVIVVVPKPMPVAPAAPPAAKPVEVIGSKCEEATSGAAARRTARIVAAVSCAFSAAARSATSAADKDCHRLSTARHVSVGSRASRWLP
jgi:hypothetical protein